jgi:Protein of unknown function (DUF4087)
MARRRGCKRKIGADEKRLPPAVLLCAPVAAFAQNSPEKLCGSFENPTPASAWLTDRSGTWTIVVQGGRQAYGDWAILRRPKRFEPTAIMVTDAPASKPWSIAPSII